MTDKMTTREYLQRLAEKGYTVITPDVMTIQNVLSLYEQLDSLRDALRDANEGLKLMHSLATGGETSVLSRLDNGVDAVDAQRWQDEAIAQEADAIDWKEQVTILRSGG